MSNAIQKRGADSVSEKSDLYAETVEEQIYRLKLEGYAPREIAQFTNKGPDEVAEIAIQMAERSRQRLLAELAVGTIIEVDRLDAMHKALWPLASTGVAGAIDRVIEISKERRKLLGLDAPAGIGNPQQEADLSVLSDAEVLEYERIHRKLDDARTRKRARGRGRNPGAVIDVVAEEVGEP